MAKKEVRFANLFAVLDCCNASSWGDFFVRCVYIVLACTIPCAAEQKERTNQGFSSPFDSSAFPCRSPSLSFRKLHGHAATAGIRLDRCQRLKYGA